MNAVERGRWFWLRQVELLDESRSRGVGRVEGPLLVEVFGDGRVRAAAPSKLEGYLPQEVLQAPKREVGLALYAREEAELRLSAADGAVIGYLYPGAFLSVVPSGAGWQVALPGFKNASFPPDGAALVAWVREGALTSEVTPLAPPSSIASAGRLVEDFPPELRLAVSEADSTTFAASLCGDARVEGRRVAQYHAGVVLVGWTELPFELDRGLLRCKLREVAKRGAELAHSNGTSWADVEIVKAVPAGYLRADLAGGDVFAARLRRGQEFYLLSRTRERTARCRRWRLRRTLDGGRFEGEEVEIEGRRVRPWFSLAYEAATPERAGQLLLKGPHWGAHGGYRCATPYSVVGATDAALRVYPMGWSDARIAWHPDDEERWFFTRSGCEAAARAAEPSLRAGATQPPGGFHVSCAPEL